jgi:hypothetical protein
VRSTTDRPQHTCRRRSGKGCHSERRIERKEQEISTELVSLKIQERFYQLHEHKKNPYNIFDTPYGTYLIYYFWSHFSGAEGIGESTQGYFMLISIYSFGALSGTEWTFFYKAFQIRQQCFTNIIIFFILLNSLAWLSNGLVLQELPFKHNLSLK